MDRIDPALLERPAPGTTARRNPVALIVDDDGVGRAVLGRALVKLGHDLVMARNGAEGVARYQDSAPDIVFMDVRMPVMDGHEAGREIKRLAGDRFVPLVFVTATDDEDGLLACAEAGGDAFLIKPYTAQKVIAQVRAMGRIAAVHRRTLELGNRLSAEQHTAKLIFDNVLLPPNVRPPALRFHLSPATTFSGDLYLSAYGPDGSLHVLLGDFTGHGLAAAVGALPAAAVFRAMCAKGFAPAAILGEINTKLRGVLPTGLFFAAAYVQVSRALDHATVINCGLPEVWLFGGAALRARFPSTGLALAVLADVDYAAEEVRVPIVRGDRILMLSDGAMETMNRQGALLGETPLRLAVQAALANGGSALAGAIEAIDHFRQDAALTDDVTLAEIEFTEGLFIAAAGTPAGADIEFAPPAQRTPVPASTPSLTGSAPGTAHDGWHLDLQLRGQTLRDTNPVPALLTLFKEFPGVAGHNPALFTILAELYNNALDHGVLHLDSTLKSRDFSTYLDERERRLAEVGAGSVKLSIDCAHDGSARHMKICVEDSGTGFDTRRLPVMTPEVPAPVLAFGRGIGLVRGLCESLDYDDSGKRACAVYAWNTDDGKS